MTLEGFIAISCSNWKRDKASYGPKIPFITLEKLISAKMSDQNSEIKEDFPIRIFFVVDG